MNKFYSIITRFAENHLPPEVVAKFASWFVSDKDVQQKNEAMETWWNALADAKPTEKTRRELKKLNREIDMMSNFKLHRAVLNLARFVAVLAVIITAGVVGYKYFTRTQDTMYVVTAERSKGYFELPDGSLVWLNENSSITYGKDFNSKERRITLEGEGFFDVVHGSAPFIVKTGYFDVTVHGTKFNVDCQKDRDYAEVCLVEGKVSVSTREGKDIDLTPGHLFHMSKLSKASNVIPVHAENFQRWASEKMVFFNTPAFDIIQSISKWYNVRIFKEKDTRLDDIMLSLTVSTQPLEDILNYMSMVSDLEYQILEDDSIMISRKGASE